MNDDLKHLIKDKYEGNASLVTANDEQRLASGEPLAYVIGWIPFLGLKIFLDSHPLIPRSETEWWTEKLIEHLHIKYKDQAFSFLDLCAGSGAVGLAVLKHCPNARVSFAEIVSEHSELIKKNIDANALDTSRADIHTGDLFIPLAGTTYDIIATNPPYIPEDRVLEKSVAEFEPAGALFAGADGLSIIRRIAKEVKAYIHNGSELWLETDTDSVTRSGELLAQGGALLTLIQNDVYDRPRLVIAYY